MSRTQKILLAVMLFLIACFITIVVVVSVQLRETSDSPNHAEITLSPINNLLNGPDIAGYTFALYDNYNSPAEENGLGGKKIYVKGRCASIENDDECTFAYLNDNGDIWLVGLSTPAMDTGETFDFLVDNEVYVFGEYMGFSEVYKLPSMFYETIICNGMSYNRDKYIMERLLLDEDETDFLPTAETTEPSPLKTALGPDFLDNMANIDLVYNAIEKYQYSECLLAVEEYIANVVPSQTDSAFKIKDMLTTLSEEIKNCKVKHDDFEDTYTVFYDNVESISKNVNVVPRIEEGDFYVRVGFRKSDWLFFDEITIKTSTGEMIDDFFNSWDMQTDVISGGIIEEYIDTSFNSEECQKLLNSDSLTIRFINGDNDKYYEHKLSDNELNALKTIISIDNMNAELSSLAYEHKELLS